MLAFRCRGLPLREGCALSGEVVNFVCVAGRNGALLVCCALLVACRQAHEMLSAPKERAAISRPSDRPEALLSTLSTLLFPAHPPQALATRKEREEIFEVGEEGMAVEDLAELIQVSSRYFLFLASFQPMECICARASGGWAVGWWP